MSDPASYNYKVVRQFSIMTVVWGVVGMLVGVIITVQLIWLELNLAARAVRAAGRLPAARHPRCLI